MLKYLFITFGTIFLGVGIIGVFVPILPTTPFLLLSAACYVRSSNRLYTWLINHKLFGKFVRDFRESRSISLRNKIISLLSMTLMITLSVFLFVEVLYLKLILIILGVIGFIVILSIPTLKSDKYKKT